MKQDSEPVSAEGIVIAEEPTDNASPQDQEFLWKYGFQVSPRKRRRNHPTTTGRARSSSSRTQCKVLRSNTFDVTSIVKCKSPIRHRYNEGLLWRASTYLWDWAVAFPMTILLLLFKVMAFQWFCCRCEVPSAASMWVFKPFIYSLIRLGLILIYTTLPQTFIQEFAGRLYAKISQCTGSPHFP